MQTRNLLLAIGAFFSLALLSACSKQDPVSALDKAAIELEQAVAQRHPKAVMKLLHQNFQGSHGMDRQTAQQQMLALFLRYQNIKVLVVNRNCELDKGFYDRGECTAQVGVTGAQGLIPERAELYRVSTTWQLQNKRWLLLSMSWE